MAKAAEDTRSGYRKAMRERTQALREARRISQAKMAELLSVKLDTYKKWENRSIIPTDYIENFCLITGIEIAIFIKRGPVGDIARKARGQKANN